jgi:hypothetical protein
VTRFQDLPVADRDLAWDGDAADRRVRRWADAEDSPTSRYRDAHVWYDGDKPENFTSYKLLIADVVDGSLKVVPRGLMAAANVVQGGRGCLPAEGRHRTGPEPSRQVLRQDRRDAALAEVTGVRTPGG